MNAAFHALSAQPSTDAPKPSRVLLLQGPVGPFFARLRSFLESEGLEPWQVSFHAGDRIFNKRARTLRFCGSVDDWPNWLAQVIAAGRFDTLILFGSERPAHSAARELAKTLGLKVTSLEEGYIRPGFITVESGGNNANSPLAGVVKNDHVETLPDTTPATIYNSLRPMILYSALFYTTRGLTTFGKRRQLFHRKTPLLSEVFHWGRNFFRRVSGGERNFSKIQQLLEHWDKRFYLVPLQVGADMNMVRFSNGWNSVRLITESIRSFAATAPSDTRLVFKIHPMERGHNNLTPLIRQTAEDCGVAGRVDMIETGSLGLLTRHSAGMITINSSSGLSAIFHGVTLMVLGRALYANPKLAMTTPTFEEFWTSDHVAPPALRSSYIAWIKQHALKPGDFYCSAGMEVAMHSVLDKITQTEQAEPKVTTARAAS